MSAKGSLPCANIRHSEYECQPLSGPYACGSAAPVALPSSCARRQLAREVTAIPASLALFLHEFLGERAVRQGKSHEAAPDVFRRYDGSF
jgi:hypothetical protein